MGQRLKQALNFLIYLFVFFLPLATVWLFNERYLNGAKWQYGSGMIFATEILLWLIIFLWAGTSSKLKTQNLKQKVKNLQFNHFSFAFLALSFFVILNLFSLFWSADKPATFYHWFHLAEAVLFFLILINLKIDWQKICLALGLSGALESVLALQQFFWQGIGANKWLGISQHLGRELGASVVEVATGRFLRAYGTFVHPNLLAGFLLLAFAAALFVYLHARRDWHKILSLVCLTLITAGLFVSFSRAAWLALIFGLLAWLIAYFFQDRTKILELIKAVIVVVLVSSCLFVVYQPLVMARLGAQGRLEQKSVNERLDSFSQAKEIITANWLLGVGGNNYTYQLHQMYPKAAAYDLQPVHNIYLLILAELGIFGLFSFIIFCVSVLFLGVKRRNYFWSIIFLLFLAICLVDHYLLSQYAGLLVLYLSAALVIEMTPKPHDL